MSLQGERFIIAATLEPLEVGQEFSELPPSTTLVEDFQMQEHHRERFLKPLMKSLFTEPRFQEVVGSEYTKLGPNKEVLAKKMFGADASVLFALRSLVRSLDTSAGEMVHIDRMSVAGNGTPMMKLRRGRTLAYSTVALFSHSVDDSTQYVRDVYSVTPEIES